MSSKSASAANATKYPLMYQGSVKDLRGPVQVGAVPGVVFDYTDAYSVFDWGRMPDLLTAKGEALAIIAADWLERLERADSWKEFSKTQEAMNLRKANRFGSSFNELGEELQREGMRTHYLGVVTPQGLARTSDVSAPFRQMAVKQVSVVKPAAATVLGRSVPDYLPTRNAPAPRLIPLEVIFRFSCPEGSSLLERVSRDPGYLASIGYPDLKVESGKKWDFPVLEVFTKLESTDRPVTLAEALAISGLSAPQLQTLLLKTAWVAGWIKSICVKNGIELADGKLEWALDEQGQLLLVDAIGPDELRLLRNGVQLSKEFLRIYYRGTSWYQAINQAKDQAKTQGISDWKRLAGVNPPALPASHRELATQLYQSLANQLTGKTWFPQAWGLDKVVEGIQGMNS